MNTETRPKTQNRTKTSFKLKGNAFTLTTLQLLELDPNMLDKQLLEKVDSAPNFFNGLPVVIDCQALIRKSGEFDLDAHLNIIRKHQLHPIGVRSSLESHLQQARAAKLPVFADTNKEAVQASKKVESMTQATSKVVSTPIRSGQQVYARGGDLIILGPVSAGAEVLADGNIHVYGPLRGRALAGILGNNQAHIFCASLEAELLSIAGHYKVSEQLKESLWKQSANVFIQDENLEVVPL